MSYFVKDGINDIEHCEPHDMVKDECWKCLRAALAEKESQLPEGMKHCSILFKKCALGHGWLTAKNWVQHDCPTCRAESAEKEAQGLREKFEATEQLRLNIISGKFDEGLWRKKAEAAEREAQAMRGERDRERVKRLELESLISSDKYDGSSLAQMYLAAEQNIRQSSSYRDMEIRLAAQAQEIKELREEQERIRALWGEAATERDLLVSDKAAILGGIQSKELAAKDILLAEQAAVIERAKKFEEILQTDVADALEMLCDGQERSVAALLRRAARKINALSVIPAPPEKPHD